MIVSCQQEEFAYSNYEAVKGKWHKNDTLRFAYTPQDTIHSYNVYISLRNSLEYEFKNIFLISSITFPNGKVVVDTLEYPMAYNDGSFIGKGSSIIENKLWLKENVRFNEEGEYSFKIRQAMRETGAVEALQNLKGVVDVGIQIEEIQNK
jgi:gliding motility-associated lipoprotein GldH